jgi:hypothetical protein
VVNTDELGLPDPNNCPEPLTLALVSAINTKSLVKLETDAVVTISPGTVVNDRILLMALTHSDNIILTSGGDHKQASHRPIEIV